MNKEQPYEVHEGRRKYPRIIVNTPVEIHYQDEVIQALIHDISIDGLQVRCDRKSMQKIHPSGKFIRKENAPALDVTFHLSIDEKAREIKAFCLMYYFVVLPDEKERDIAFGLHFARLEGDSSKHIDAFISDALTPVESKILGFLDQARTVQEIAGNLNIKPEEINTILIKLVEEGEVISIGKGKPGVHIRFVAAIRIAFEKIAEFDKRLSILEQKLK